MWTRVCARFVWAALFVLSGAFSEAAAIGVPAPIPGAGGSRLLYYFRQTSFDSGAGVTLFTVSNNWSTTVSVRFTIFNASDCSTAGPFTISVPPSEIRTLAVSDFAPPSLFPAGVIDLWAVNSAEQPIRYDFLTGTSVIADFGPGSTSAVTVPAAKLFSDDRNDYNAAVIADQDDRKTSGPRSVSAPLLLPQTPGSSEDTIVLISPARDPGAAPPLWTPADLLVVSAFPAPQFAQFVPGSCVYTATVTETLGPGVGAGKLSAFGFSGKGLIGWKFLKVTQPSFTVLLGELMQSYLARDETASSQ